MNLAGSVLPVACAAFVACVTVPPEPPPVESRAPDAEPVVFELERVEGGTLHSSELRGRATVVLLGATYDTPSQAAVRIASAVVRRHRPRVNGVMIVLEPPENRPIAQAFVAALDLPFPAVFADARALAGEGPFPGLRHVPSVVLLDSDGREVWRRVGLVGVDVLEEALRQHAR